MNRISPAPSTRMRIRGGNDEGTTVHALVCEGLNLVFAKHRRPEIAQ